jgi:hypothetical protein
VCLDEAALAEEDAVKLSLLNLLCEVKGWKEMAVPLCESLADNAVQPRGIWPVELLMCLRLCRAALSADCVSTLLGCLRFVLREHHKDQSVCRAVLEAMSALPIGGSFRSADVKEAFLHLIAGFWWVSAEPLGRR